MICPICGRNMEEGGLIAEKAIMVSWHPKAEFEKKGLKTWFYHGGKILGKHHVFRDTVTIPQAWYCRSCNKVSGIFDVEGDLEL